MKSPNTSNQPPETFEFDLSVLGLFDGEILLRRLVMGASGKKAPTKNFPSIVWATDSYVDRGVGYQPQDEITLAKLRKLGDRLRVRAGKDKTERAKRVRDKAEVFTPAWVCAFMNEFLDEEWFGRKEVFTRRVDAGWETIDGKIKFPRAKRGQPKRGWEQYVKSPRLEITCGEAPFIASRYDAATGEKIPLADRVGILDRKLRVVSQNAKTQKKWLDMGYAALRSVYGYEWQGDSLFLARLNVVETFREYYEDFVEPQAEAAGAAISLTREQLNEAAEIAAYNFWQMDGLTGEFPMVAPYVPMSLLEFIPEPSPPPDKSGISDSQSKKGKRKTKIASPTPKGKTQPILICRWPSAKSPGYCAFKEKEMKFDYIIGNPPYQIEIEGNNRTRPVYCDFMDGAYEVGNKVELITPGRFLFRAGFTSDEWNDKMLSDPHLKVLEYQPDSSLYFSDVDIKGGIVITFRNGNQEYGAIEVFFAFPELKSVYQKVKGFGKFESIEGIVYPYNTWNKNELLKDFPELKNAIGSSPKIGTNAFEAVPIFRITPLVAIISAL